MTKGIEQDHWILYSQMLQCGLELKITKLMATFALMQIPQGPTM